MHPEEVVYLEHDGKVLLVDAQGKGPHQPVQGRTDTSRTLRFPTVTEVEQLGIDFVTKDRLVLRFDAASHVVIKAYPKIQWPQQWAWKDACIADNAVHPVASGKRSIVPSTGWYQK